MTETDADTDASLPLDEEDELYGYGVFNVHKNTFVSRLGGTDPDVFETVDEVRDHFEDVTEDMDDTKHLRIVRVHLDNELDKDIAESSAEPPKTRS